MQKKLISLKSLYIFIVMFSLLVFILACNGYYITFVKPAMNTFTLFLLTVFACYQLLNMTKLQKLNAILITFWIITPILFYPIIKYIWNVGSMSYHTIVSPDRSEELLIEYKKVHSFTSEIGYRYNIYYKTIFPYIVKRVENGEIKLIVYSNYDALKLLNVENATWLSGEAIIFHPLEDEQTVKVTW